MPYAAPMGHRQSWPHDNHESRPGYAAMPPPSSATPQFVPYTAVHPYCASAPTERGSQVKKTRCKNGGMLYVKPLMSLAGIFNI
ncbi:5'-3' exoribonuclease, partial [Trifolium medium]|nr:5'-3' exoribonuclease [Trifolium medium]